MGLLVELKDRFVLTSNRESGLGRYDIMLEPLSWEGETAKGSNHADDYIIIEFKVFQPRKEKDLSDTVAGALRQIEEMKYEQILLAKGVPTERIRKYGFAFRGKEVLIGSGK